MAPSSQITDVGRIALPPPISSCLILKINKDPLFAFENETLQVEVTVKTCRLPLFQSIVMADPEDPALYSSIE